MAGGREMAGQPGAGTGGALGFEVASLTATSPLWPASPLCPSSFKRGSEAVLPPHAATAPIAHAIATRRKPRMRAGMTFSVATNNQRPTQLIHGEHAGD